MTIASLSFSDWLGFAFLLICRKDMLCPFSLQASPLGKRHICLEILRALKGFKNISDKCRGITTAMLAGMVYNASQTVML